MEKDPNGIPQHCAGAKLDAGKNRLGLLLDFHLALSEVGKVATYGANKYTDGGWQTVPEGEKRYTDAMLRHLVAEKQLKLDSESGLLHAAQVAWNALARLEFILREHPVRDGALDVDYGVIAPDLAYRLDSEDGAPQPIGLDEALAR